MKMNQFVETTSALFLRLKRACELHLMNISMLESLEFYRIILLMKKNSEASAPQLFSSGNSIIAGFSSISREFHKRAEKVFPSKLLSITRQFCNTNCYIFSEMRWFCA